ncbi:exodeoxyribonuclease VII small subunit [Pseudoramibacter sp.]|jgi:exodeoxyribonuclease VII small subunit|uniref:exodeoxyribonuclease VII small subunit n=1 Tax=Pseudoramibacter sp. TaxID=2034862 RepID=UPI0025E0B9F3|nr:exodeoxyribonuclease VII small subunit [Pseudoramibacter sp.]MCH4072895.1 exodeoxyribonuclease VII small subunit [Pseudoramibacter sp.]MCH4106666.1 exodeoxyribonuclease VII small subunit [Pseudoramibacter sp.]
MARKKTFDEKMSRLKEIISMMDKDTLSLEESLKYYEEGVTLLKKCEKDLNTAEGKIEVLSKDQSDIVLEDSNREK